MNLQNEEYYYSYIRSVILDLLRLPDGAYHIATVLEEVCGEGQLSPQKLETVPRLAGEHDTLH